MPRRREIPKREVPLDPIYSSSLVTKFISTLMSDGKRNTAEKIMYASMTAIQEKTDLGLVDEFKMVSALTRRPVKVTMTGPHMLSNVAYDEHYNDSARMMADIGKLLTVHVDIVVNAAGKDDPLAADAALLHPRPQIGFGELAVAE